MESRDTDYKREMVAALRTRDHGKLREFLRRSAEERDLDRVSEIDGISDQDMQIRMHKMIVATPELADLHSESRAWLADHGRSVSF